MEILEDQIVVPAVSQKVEAAVSQKVEAAVSQKVGAAVYQKVGDFYQVLKVLKIIGGKKWCLLMIF